MSRLLAPELGGRSRWEVCESAQCLYWATSNRGERETLNQTTKVTLSPRPHCCRAEAPLKYCEVSSVAETEKPLKGGGTCSFASEQAGG